jgi:hypothetical protein
VANRVLATRQTPIPVEDFERPSPEIAKFQDKTIIAFDMMSIHSSDLPILPSLKEALVVLHKLMPK